MSLFANQLSAKRAAAVKVAQDALNTGEVGIATESLGTEEIDQFAEQREQLNAELAAIEATVEQSAIVEQVEAEPVVQVESVTEAQIEEPVAEPLDEPIEAPVEEPVIVPDDESLTAEDGTGRPEAEIIGDDVVVVPPAGAPVVDGEVVIDVESTDHIDFEDEDEYTAEAEELAALEADMLAMEMLETEISMLDDSRFAVETYGINPTAAAILQTTGLLNGTALESLGLEAFGYRSPKDDETMMALEALNDKAAEQKASYAARILSAAANVGGKVLDALSAIWDKVSAAAAKVGSVVWDKTKAAGAVAKAHPYATIAVVIGAIAAVAGIVAFAGGFPAAGATVAQLKAYASGVATKINGIKWPFGEIKATVAEQTGKLSVMVKNGSAAAKANSVKALGWTQTVAKAAAGQAGRAWTATKTATTSFGGKAVNVAKNIKTDIPVLGKKAVAFGKDLNSGVNNLAKGVGDVVGDVTRSNALGTITEWSYKALVWSGIFSVVKLLYSVVAFGLRLIANTFRALVSAVA